MSDRGAPATDPPSALPSRRGPSLQRRCACGGGSSGCTECKAEDDAKLQRKAATPGAVTTAPPVVHDVLRSSGSRSTRQRAASWNPRFGRDFADVRIHDDALASRSARAVGARAYTVGSRIAFADGEYRPGAEGGRRLLAHELAHVVQQSHAAPASMLHDEGGTLRRAAQPGEPVIYWGGTSPLNPVATTCPYHHPGGLCSEVAAFVYGDAAMVDSLRAANPGKPDFLTGGAVLRSGGGRRPAASFCTRPRKAGCYRERMEFRWCLEPGWSTSSIWRG